jgi:hypothetical protein
MSGSFRLDDTIKIKEADPKARLSMGYRELELSS